MMQQQTAVFRKVSLDRLSSPEQLDQLLPVTDGRGWVALTAIVVVLVSTVVWGVLGSIPQNVLGTGILVKSGGVLEVIPVASGELTEVGVAVGDRVTEGQIVARMAQPELATRIEQAKASLEVAKQRHAQLVAFGDKDLELQAKQLARQRKALKQAIRGASRARAWADEKIDIEEKLVAAGLLLRQNLIETKQKRHATVERIDDAESQLAQIEVKELELRNRRDEAIAKSQADIEEEARRIDDMDRELLRKTQIVSPYTGRILEVLAEPGMVVGAGDPVLRLDLAGQSSHALEAVIYVPSQFGKQIEVGMDVLVAPATVKQEEYGMLVAKVTSVSDFPSSAKAMQRVLKNDTLVTGLSGGDSPYEVRAELIPDTTTPSQYRWSSSKGPPQKIESGTMARAHIAVASRRPVQLVLPLFREYTGL